MNASAFQRAVDVAGGQKALALGIGTSQSNVWYWLNKAKSGVPAEWVQKVEGATGIPRHALRPDLYPPPAPSTHGEAA